MKKLIITTIAAIGLSGLAQAETINFGGTVSTTCAFSNNVTGTMVNYTDGIDYALDAGFTQGTAASVDVAYSGAPTFAINAVTGFSSAPNGAPTPQNIYTGIVFNNSQNSANAAIAGADMFTSGTKTFGLDGGASQDTAHVKMKAVANGPWAVGQYDANTTVTCQ